ncbi:MAG: AEC family transporter [Betaproteobacteria bacterium]
MNTPLILVPDFLLILFGLALNRFSSLDPNIWLSLEKIVYWVLFPCLLISSTNHIVIHWQDSFTLLLMLWSVLVIILGLSLCARWLFSPNLINMYSGSQTTFRFNTYIALAAAGRMLDDTGVAQMAITIACIVPVNNLLAILTLSKNSQVKVWLELIRNPFLLATLIGLLLNTFGIHIPSLIQDNLVRLGNASIPLGLLTVGAGLRWVGSKKDALLIGYWATLKLLVFPSIIFLLGTWLGLSQTQLIIAVLIAAVPTATTSYVLTNRMGGNGALVSVAISVQTLLAAITLPFWLSLVYFPAT